MLKLTGKKLTALAAAALTTLTISATAFAAAFTSADAQSMAAKLVPASATHVATKEEYPNASFHKVKLDMDDGLYEYELKFTTSELRGEMVLNPETGAVIEKELRYNVR